MRVHHLNCISLCPLSGLLANHNLLIETDSSGLVLVDTGLGLNEVNHPETRLSRFFLKLLRPDFREEMTAIRQIERLGFDPKDVRHIILTHLDFDHAGGMDDFPWATVHMLRAERDYAFLQNSWLDRQRFRPGQWGTKNNWKVYEADEGERWFGFNRVNALDGLPSEIALIPLIGHTFGHAGVAVKRGAIWLLNAGDAYFFHQEIDVVNPYCTPRLALYQRMLDKDYKTRIWNQLRLRDLNKDHSREVLIFCSHDVREFERLSGRSAMVPIEK